MSRLVNTENAKGVVQLLGNVPPLWLPHRQRTRGVHGV